MLVWLGDKIHSLTVSPSCWASCSHTQALVLLLPWYRPRSGDNFRMDHLYHKHNNSAAMISFARFWDFFGTMRLQQWQRHVWAGSSLTGWTSSFHSPRGILLDWCPTSGKREGLHPRDSGADNTHFMNNISASRIKAAEVPTEIMTAACSRRDRRC